MRQALAMFKEFNHIVVQWHPTKNDTLTPHDVEPGSSRIVWWLGDCGHEWDARVFSRTTQKYGCPFCSGKRTLAGFNDLATTSPQLAQQWHPTKNVRESTEVTASSNKSATWQCAKYEDHVWAATILSRTQGNGCPYCANRKVLAGFNDLASNMQYNHVVPQWHPSKNELDPSAVMPGSNKKVWWQCEQGHEWEAVIANRTHRGSGCPRCPKDKTPAPLVKDSSLASQWHPDNALDMGEVTLKSAKRALWICSEDERHVWEAAISNRFRGSGCLYCAGKKTLAEENLTTHAEFAGIVAEWHADNDLSPDEVHPSHGTPVLWQCNEGHEWRASVHERTRKGNKCPECAGRRSNITPNKTIADFPELVAEWHEDNPFAPTDVTMGSNKRIKWKCAKNTKHIWTSTALGRTINKYGCPACSGTLVIPGVNDLASDPRGQDLLDQWHSDNTELPTTVTVGSNKQIKWVCPEDSSHVWSTTVYSRVIRGSGCLPCSRKANSSKGEIQVYEALLALGLGVSQHETSLVAPLELDMYVPAQRFAVEFNGVYWHSEAVRKDRDYHASKKHACSAAGVRLFQVWEDDWSGKRDLVVRTLAQQLGVLDQLPLVMPSLDGMYSEVLRADGLLVDALTTDEADGFFLENHLLGAVSARSFFGLRDSQNRLRAAVALTPGESPGNWVIVRQASAGEVVGGLDRLLTHAASRLNATSWSVDADLSLDEGEQYANCGFAPDRLLSPSFSYLVASKRAGRDVFSPELFRSDPHFLYEDGLSEEELGDLNQMIRIWDSGSLRYVRAA